jgi:site-specific recombinase XerD
VDELTNLDPEPVRAFIHVLDGKDPKTIAAYRGTVRAFVAWLATMHGGEPFRMELVTATAIRGYLEALMAAGRAPRTQAKATTALRRFRLTGAAEPAVGPADTTPANRDHD